MKRQLLILFAMTAMLVGMPAISADASNGRGGFRGHGHSRGVGLRAAHGFKGGHGFGGGFGGGFFIGDDSDFAELYRELRKNLPYFTLHPPVYYSYPVPRTYGYSPFAYLPTTLTPEVAPPEPMDIINPHVPSNGESTPAHDVSDRSAAVGAQPQPLVIINPYVSPNRAVAQSRQ